MSRIKINTIDQLLKFVKETDLSLDQYRSIIATYSGTKLFVIYREGQKEFGKVAKQNLISLIEKQGTSHIEEGFPAILHLSRPHN